MNKYIFDQVRPLYMEDANLLKCKAIVKRIGTSEINKKPYRWIQLDQTIFHPKGGGQLHDEGTINGMPVVYVHKQLLDKNRIDQFEILHCFDMNQDCSLKEGDEVELAVDPNKRSLYSKMHTAGHVLADVVNKIFPELEGFHGNHDPKDGYVKFKMHDENAFYDKEDVKKRAQAEVISWVTNNIPVVVTKQPSGLRAIQIAYRVMPCGGTHVNNLQDIGRIEIADVSINKKEATLTVKYSVNSER